MADAVQPTDEQISRIEKAYALAGKQTPEVSQARDDGRPLYYHTTGTDKVGCILCRANGIATRYAPPESFFNDPANSPVIDKRSGKPDGGVYTVCRGHLPENAVAYDPVSGDCHNKSGSEVWREGP